MSTVNLVVLTKCNEEIAALKFLWQDLLPGEQPSTLQFHVWRDLHDLERITHAIGATTRKMEALQGSMTLEYRIRFASKVMNDSKRGSLQIVAPEHEAVAP